MLCFFKQCHIFSFKKHFSNTGPALIALKALKCCLCKVLLKSNEEEFVGKTKC